MMAVAALKWSAAAAGKIRRRGWSGKIGRFPVFRPFLYPRRQKIRLFPEGFLRKQPFSFSGRDKYCPAPLSREET